MAQINPNNGSNNSLNTGTITVTGDDSNSVYYENRGLIQIESSGRLTNYLDSDYGHLSNNGGRLINNGTLTNSAQLINKYSSTLTNSGTLTSSGYLYNLYYSNLTNSGTLTNSTHNHLENYDNSTITNSGTLTNSGNFYNNYSSTITNSGTLTNSRFISNFSYSTLINSGTLTNSGTLQNYYNSTLTNSGTFTNSGVLENNYDSTITNSSNGTLYNNGDIYFNNYDGFTNNGTLAGTGTFHGLLSGGTVSPGNSGDRDATFTINGNFNLGTLTTSFSGIDVGDFDILKVNGDTNLLSSGSLNFLFDEEGLKNDITEGQTKSIAFLQSSGLTNSLDLASFAPTDDGDNGADFDFEVKQSDNNLVLDITRRVFNTAPTVNNISKTGIEDSSINFTATDFNNAFSDVDGNNLNKIKITSLPNNGSLKLGSTVVNVNQEISAADLGNLAFSPAPNFNGTTSFNWNASDGTIYAATGATANLALSAVNDAPNATNDQVATSKGTAVTVELGDNVSDIEGLTGAILSTTDAVGGTVTLIDSDAQQITFTPGSNFVGTASFKYTIADAGGLFSSTATVTVDVGDIISTGNQSQTITGNNGNDYISAGNGKDTITGLGGADTLLGNNGADSIFGGNGIDKIWGGNGDDLLDGGSGSDQVTGGNGSDRFVIAAQSGTDTISDFVAGTDLIGLSGGISFGSLSFTGNNILLASTNETLATLTGVNTSTLNAANFVNI